MKQCLKCKEIKPINNFYLKKNNKPHSYCNECNKKLKAAWFLKNRTQSIINMKNNYANNRDIRKEQTAKYYRDKITYYKAYNQSYYNKNKENLSFKKSQTRKTKYHSDECFKIKCLLRSRLNMALKNNQKAGSAVKDLGCSIDELKTYLESKFLPGMTWDNYGRKGWHIDHIKPLANFDLSNREDFLKACHYSNLQPLWWYDNLSKGNR